MRIFCRISQRVRFIKDIFSINDMLSWKNLVQSIAGISTLFALPYGITYVNCLRNHTVLQDFPVYSSPENFSRDFAIEKHKLGIENVIVTTEFPYTEPSAHTQRITDHTYIISFNPNYARKVVLRHELYHVKQLEKSSFLFPKSAPLNCLSEWAATSYALKEKGL